MNAILDVNQEYGPFKIIRNNKKRWATINLPMYTIIDYAINRDIKVTLNILAIQFGILLGSELFAGIITKNDIYKIEAIKKLKTLVLELNDNYISTDYNLLLNSNLYQRNYKIYLNEDKLPEMLESKYVLVPTYDFNGNVKDTSILQEHIIGTNKYVLSLGSPTKQYKLAYLNT